MSSHYDEHGNYIPDYHHCGCQPIREDDHPYHEACNKCYAKFMRMRMRAQTAETRLLRARAALIDTGYFTENEVSYDIAPRIIELLQAIETGAHDLRKRPRLPFV